MQVGLDDEAAGPFGRLLRRWELFASELPSPALRDTVSDETDSVVETDAPTDDDGDPLGNLVRRAAAVLDH